MDCPVCKVPLIAVERDQIEVDYCISCRGLWFDRGELEILAEKFRLPLGVAPLLRPHAGTSERPRGCPRCGKNMEKAELAANRRVVIDRCSSGDHGMWFDARELGTLLDHASQVAGASGPVVQFLGEMFGKEKST